jgi:hypothetical protein
MLCELLGLCIRFYVKELLCLVFLAAIGIAPKCVPDRFVCPDVPQICLIKYGQRRS